MTSQKIESGKLDLDVQPFSVRDAVSDALRPLALSADKKGLELITDVRAEVPTGIAGDQGRLRQVLSNLVGNAIKFTDSGHVLVEVREQSRTEDQTHLEFRVTDTGIGVPADKREAIFEPFMQADGSTTRRFGGTGLGLTISSTLVRMMNGDLWVEDNPDGGSVFAFTIACPIAGVPDRDRHEPLLEGLHVLVVDDNAVNRRILVEQLTRWHMKPVTVDGGRAALDVLTAAAAGGEPFVLVLLDAHMPDLDGFGVAEAIAARQDLAGATIMMLTSSGHYGDAARCRALAISAYLTKPIKQADLLDSICSILQGQGARATPLGRGISTPGAQRVRVLLAEDNLVNRAVAVGLLTRRGHEVVVAGNGVEVLEALEHETFDVVLMDVQMPVMGGFEATRLIRERERDTGGHIPIVALTAHAMSGDRERCLAAGMDGYLAKPVDRLELFAAVERGDPSISLEPTVDREAGQRVYDRQALLDRVGGDEMLVTELFSIFLADVPTRLAAIDAALTDEDWPNVSTAAHALRGAALNLSADRVGAAAKALELAADARNTGDLAALAAALRHEVSRLTTALRAEGTS